MHGSLSRIHAIPMKSLKFVVNRQTGYRWPKAPTEIEAIFVPLCTVEIIEKRP